MPFPISACESPYGRLHHVRPAGAAAPCCRPDLLLCVLNIYFFRVKCNSFFKRKQAKFVPETLIFRLKIHGFCLLRSKHRLISNCCPRCFICRNFHRLYRFKRMNYVCIGHASHTPFPEPVKSFRKRRPLSHFPVYPGRLICRVGLLSAALTCRYRLFCTRAGNTTHTTCPSRLFSGLLCSKARYPYPA